MTHRLRKFSHRGTDFFSSSSFRARFFSALMAAIPASVIVWAPTVEAAEYVDSATRATARKLGYEGVSLYLAEDYRAATERLERAYKMLQVPSLALWSARALEKSGKFVEASERYLKATRLPDDTDGEASVQQKSRDEAAADRKKLLPRIPSLTISVEGAAPGNVELSIGGDRVSSAAIGGERPTNPGDVLVQGKVGSQIVEKKVQLLESQNISVTLTFASESPVSVLGKSQPDALTDTPEDSGAASRDWQKPAGWIGIGLGGAGIATGAIFGILGLGSQLSECEKDICPRTVDEKKMNAHNMQLSVSSVGFIAGGILGAAGVTLLLTAPKKSDSAMIQPYLGTHSAGVYGRF